MRHLPFWGNQLIMISMLSLKPLHANVCISSDDVSCGR